MKKFSVLFLILFYFLSVNTCFAAVSNLYFVKNIDKSTVKTIVEPLIDNGKYNIHKKDPYYAVLKADASNYIIVILQTTGNNLFYYFQSTDNNTVDKNILKALKKANITYEQTQNQKYISLYESQAQKVLMYDGNVQYDFSEPTQQKNVYTPQQTPQSTTLKGYVGKVEKGTSFKIYLQTPINTATANKGDTVTAVLTDDWTYNGHIIAPQGSLVTGYLSKARHATYGSLNGRVVINFNKLTAVDGKTYDISVEDVDFTVTNDGKLKSSARNIAYGALWGALGGLVVALCSRDVNYGSAIAIGAASGAGLGAVKSGVEAGIDAEIPVYTELDLTLSKALSVSFQY
ncbi:TrbI/VirB10 family protein [bacterium]|nr:TrbI/VirB10 family protein [bacterium]